MVCRGAFPHVFFFWDAHLLFFLWADFPSTPIVRPSFFFWDAHLLHFFLMGVFLRFFLTPRKSKVLVKILFSHFSIFFMGRKLFHAQYTLGHISFTSQANSIFLKIYSPIFRPSFFFFGAPIFFKKKRWALFFGAHLPPIFFFFSAHLSPIPSHVFFLQRRSCPIQAARATA